MNIQMAWRKLFWLLGLSKVTNNSYRIYIFVGVNVT